VSVSSQHLLTLRRELSLAERALHHRAEHEAIRFARAEHVAWREAQDVCFAYDDILQNVSRRLAAIRAGEHERFPGESQLAEMAFRDADRADSAYTVISFAGLRDRLRYLRSESGREAAVRETLERSGLYTDACGGRHFQGIVR
jgi:hypothetical protein